MSRATIAFLSAVLILASCVAYVLWPRGRRSFVVTEVSQPFSASVSSPIRPFGSGDLYVLVEGQLDGEAVLQVSSNRRRDKHEIELRGPQVLSVHGGAEEWVDDLQVQYRPITAKAGKLYVALYCGAGFSREDRERYHRITRKKH